SAAELGNGKESVGTHAYAEHPTTEVLCVSFARGNSPVETWIPGQPIPEMVLAAAVDPRCSWVAPPRLGGRFSRSPRLHDVTGAFARLSRQPRRRCQNSRSGEP